MYWYIFNFKLFIIFLRKINIMKKLFYILVLILLANSVSGQIISRTLYMFTTSQEKIITIPNIEGKKTVGCCIQNTSSVRYAFFAYNIGGGYGEEIRLGPLKEIHIVFQGEPSIGIKSTYDMGINVVGVYVNVPNSQYVNGLKIE